MTYFQNTMLFSPMGGNIASLAVAVANIGYQSIMNIAKSMNPVLFIETTKSKTLFTV